MTDNMADNEGQGVPLLDYALLAPCSICPFVVSHEPLKYQNRLDF